MFISRVIKRVLVQTENYLPVARRLPRPPRHSIRRCRANSLLWRAIFERWKLKMQFLKERPGPLGECTVPGWHGAHGRRPRQVATELIKAPAFKTRRPFVQQLSEISFASFHGGLKFRVVSIISFLWTDTDDEWYRWDHILVITGKFRSEQWSERDQRHQIGINE